MNLSEKSLFSNEENEINYSMMSGVIELFKRSDDTFEVVFLNETATRLLNFDNPEAAKQKLNEGPLEFVYPADRERVCDVLNKTQDGSIESETYRVLVNSEEFIWVLAHFRFVYVQNDLHIIIDFTNVHELMGTQARLQSEGNKLLDIVNSIPMGIAIMEIDEGGKSSVISLNDQMVAFADNIGTYLDGNSRHWTKEELTMLFNQSIYAFCANSDIPLVSGMLEMSKTNEISSCTFRLRGSTDEKPVYVKSTCHSKPVSDTARNYYITFENVTKDKLRELEIEENRKQLITISYTDSLTKVKNRNSYNLFIKNCRRFPIKNVGLLFADLNGLKKVNDVLGHQYGDDMIIRFSNLLKKYFDSDYVFRISGDEFVIICSGISRADFMSKMELVLHDIEENENIASAGYVWVDSVNDVKLVANQAEQIMYVEKQRYYEIEKSLKSKHRPLLLNSLISDFENNRFKMYLQPKADVTSSKVIGAEALVRKVDEMGRVIPPYEFIPQLEKERLIPKIDFYMLEQACSFLEKLKEEGKTDFKISVNMSRVTLVENNYLQTVERIINKYDFNVSQLEFEITESNETMDNQRLEDYIKKIKELGISISLDDVGTDYSSFPMLILDGIDCVKLDRSLITKIKTPKANKLLRHVTNMCHDLGMEVIAEGIETDDVRKDLQLINCDSFQGYLLSKPIPADEFKNTYC